MATGTGVAATGTGVPELSSLVEVRPSTLLTTVSSVNIQLDSWLAWKACSSKRQSSKTAVLTVSWRIPEARLTG